MIKRMRDTMSDGRNIRSKFGDRAGGPPAPALGPLREQARVAKEAINRRINSTANQIPVCSRNVSDYATLLSRYGIMVTKSPPFAYVPPLSMRPEVDAERVTKH